jgi:hypothetical protein
MTLYVDNNPVPTAPYVDIYAGERLGMGSTAIGREASRCGDVRSSRAGPDREHARAEPCSGIAVPVRHRGDGRGA